MNTRTVDPRTTWAVLAMEASLALPLISLATQGDRLPGLAGPMLLLLLLPAGGAAVFRFAALREPSWRLLVGIGLALLTRAIVENVPEPGLPGLLMWLGRSVAPAAIGVALWWRGGALAVAELVPADVRAEFSIIAVCLLVTLALIRPFLLPDPVLLGSAVGLFALAGLIGTALSRQDAADVAAPRLGRTLAVATCVLPAGIAVLLVGSLRPSLLTTMWLLLARAIELALTPIGLLLAWLGSLFPPGAPPTLPVATPMPTPDIGQLARLQQAQQHLEWIGTVVAIVLLAAAGLAAMLAARLLLSNFIRDPETRGDARDEEGALITETSGTPGSDAADMFGWLMRWLRGRVRGQSRHGLARLAPRDAPADAWAAYQRLLAWADSQGLGRQPSETTGQLSLRLSRQVPEAASSVDLVTRAFEWERYGGVHPPDDRLRRVREALASLAGLR